jgi:uncharacterized membrane protein
MIENADSKMFKSIVKIVAATVLFAGVHSLLASRTAKTAAAALFGERRRNGLYRPFYNVAAIVTFGGLILYAIKLPDRELYRVRGTLARLMKLVQVASLIYMLWGVRQIGFLRFYGVSHLIELLKGEPFILPEPEAQGPVLDINGKMKATGPFRTSRHPLSFGMLPVFWLMPRMTVNLAAFNIVTTLYLFIGAFHEEKRLKAAYGQAYVDYQKSGTDFFFSPISGAYSKPSIPPRTEVFG